MATFTIESNGRLEKTALYFNGEQIGGVKELFINMDENGTFDAVIQYEGIDRKIYNKSLFVEYLSNIKISEPSFTEAEAAELHRLTVESEGNIESSTVLFDDDELEGIVSVFIHIKATGNKEGLRTLFAKKEIPEQPQFKAEITFRNEDGTLETEEVY